MFTIIGRHGCGGTKLHQHDFALLLSFVVRLPGSFSLRSARRSLGAHFTVSSYVYSTPRAVPRTVRSPGAFVLIKPGLSVFFFSSNRVSEVTGLPLFVALAR